MTNYTLAGGCFWCLDAMFRRLKGVSRVVCGYTGGEASAANYRDVSSGTTGHTEAVQVMFDETVISTETILAIFFLTHDPTTKDRQGADVGSQYRSAMFYQDDAEKRLFETAARRAQKNWDAPIVTEITQLDAFYVAEPEHQDYFTHNPESGYCSVVIAPKLAKARQAYAIWFKKEEV